MFTTLCWETCMCECVCFANVFSFSFVVSVAMLIKPFVLQVMHIADNIQKSVKTSFGNC